jgi:hypothetical protein
MRILDCDRRRASPPALAGGPGAHAVSNVRLTAATPAPALGAPTLPMPTVRFGRIAVSKIVVSNMLANLE